tara:strand:+ start:2093 stop:3268 length:1176 start_codon:yes stop_codon:yes gene_type:complete
MRLKNIVFIFFALILFLRNIINLAKIIYNVKKSNVILFSTGGFGHMSTDPMFLNHLYYKKKKIIIYLSRGKKHNIVLSKCFKNLNIFFIYSTINFPFFNIFYLYNSELILKNLLNIIFKYLFKNNVFFENYLDLEKKFIDSEAERFNTDINNNYLGFISSLKLNNINSSSFFYYNETVKENIEKKINNFNSFKKNKFINFYYRKKFTAFNNKLSDENKEVRNGGDIENYFEGFRWLISKNYKILFNGDDNYFSPKKKIEIKKIFSNSIIFNEDINLSKDEFFVYSVFNSKFFIGNAGGGNNFHNLLKQPGLLLDYYPYWTTTRNSVIYYKPFINSKNKDIKISKIVNDYKYITLEDTRKIRDLNSKEILTAIINFYNEYIIKKVNIINTSN